MTDTGPALNACTYAHGSSVLHCSTDGQDYPPRPNTFGLTSRERDVAALLRLPNKEIAVRLVLEASSVKALLGRVLRKTASRTRTECALRLAGYFGS